MRRALLLLCGAWLAEVGANELADFLPARALSQADPQDIRGVAWDAVDAVNMAKMTADDLKLVTNCASIPAPLLARIPPTAVFAMDTRCLASMTPQVFASLTPQQLAQLPSSVSGSLRSAQVAALPNSSCAAFATSDLFKHFTVELCAGLSVGCVKAIPAIHRAALKAPACYQHTTSGAVKAVLDATASLPDNLEGHPQQGLQLAAVGAAGAAHAVAAHPAAAAAAAHPAAARVVTEDVLKAMLTCEAIGASELSRIDPKVFSHMTIPCMLTITPEAFVGINAAQLAAIPKEVVLHITDAQVAAMNPRTCALFATTDSFEYLSVSICGILSKECVQHALVSIQESPECMSRLKYNVTELMPRVKLNRISDLLPASSHALLNGTIDWRVVPASAFAQLNGDDLKLLQDCTHISPAQMARVNPEVLVDLPVHCVQTLHPEAFAALDIKQLYGLGHVAVGGVTAAQLAAMPAERCAAFAEGDSFDGVTAGCAGLSVPCVKFMRSKDVAKLTTRPGCKTAMPEAVRTAASSIVSAANAAPGGPAAVALLRLAALPHDCSALTLGKVNASAKEDFALMTPSCLETLPPQVFADLPVDKLNAIPAKLLESHATAEQIAALTPEKCNSVLNERDGFVATSMRQSGVGDCELVRNNCSGVQAEMIASLNVGNLKTMPVACFRTLSQAAFQAFTPDQVNHLSAEHAAACSEAQLSWLTPGQCKALNGGDFVKFQSGMACGGLTSPCLKQLSLEAFKYLVGRLNCYNHLRPEVRNTIPPSLVSRLSLRMLNVREIVSLGFCDLLSAQQVSQIGAGMPGVSRECFMLISPDAFVAVANDFRDLPTNLVSHITVAQMSSLQPAQCAAFDGSTAFKEVSAASCAGLQASCIAATPLEAFEAMMSSACFARLPKATRSSLTPEQTAKLEKLAWFPAKQAGGGEKVDQQGAPKLQQVRLASEARGAQGSQAHGSSATFLLVLVTSVSVSLLYGASRVMKTRRSEYDDFELDEDMPVRAAWRTPSTKRRAFGSEASSYSTL